MKRMILFFCFGSIIHNLAAQKIIESYIRLNDSVEVGKKIFLPCTNKGYTLVDADVTTAVTVLFTENKPDTSLKHYKDFFAEATKKQISVLFISRGIPYDFFFDKKDLDDADVLLSVALRQHNLKDKPVVLAGEGLSGTRALQFVKYYRLGQSSNLFDIKAILLFDSPLDMVRLYKSAEHYIRMNQLDVDLASCRHITYLLKLKFGSKPKSYLTRYLAYSPYSFWDESMDNNRFYKTIPVRAYTAPDIEWRLSERYQNTYDTNLPDMTGFIQSQRYAGNKYAELVVFNQRIPADHGPSHAFALANKQDLMLWVKQQIIRP